MKQCYGCFQCIDDASPVCPYCGFSLQSYGQPKWILTPGTLLNGKYRVGRTLGEGGFGITYLAWDTNMQIRTAIKEYYPGSMVSRDTTSDSGNFLTTTTGDRNGDFEVGLKRYVNEAAILARFFELPGIVTVKDFFYENGTAYIVMEYIEGVSLKRYLEEKGGKLPAKEALKLIEPLISSLAIIHRNKLLHRDISPDNIMLEKNGNIKLIDFGAARYFDGEGDKSMTVMLKHGYAPIEQYSRKGEQGAGTDIYGLCAVLYRMITGQVPVEAAERIREDKLKPVRSLAKKTPRYVAAAIEKGLSVLADNRQQSMEELYAELFASKKVRRERNADKLYRFLRKTLIVLIVCLVLVAGLGIAYFVNKDKVDDFKNRVETVFGQEEASPQDEEDGKDLHKDREESGDTGEDSSQKPKEASEEGEAADSIDQKDSGETPEKDSGTGDESRDRALLAASTPGESSGQVEEGITVARDGVLNGRSQEMTVGDILDAYSDKAGSWDGYVDENGNLYVYYRGSREGEGFSAEFQVFPDNTFTLTGAARNGEILERYADFFQEILDEVGIS